MPEQGCDGQKPARKHCPFPDELKHRCMRLLELRYDRFVDQEDLRLISAALLGRALKHWPGVKRETLRRRVRELIDEMRREGAPIASGGGGYSIAREVEDFEKTTAFLRHHGLSALETSARIKRSAAAARATGQTRLPAYHGFITGQCGLDLYQVSRPTPAPQPAKPARGDGHSAPAPNTAEPSDQQWPDALFALA